MKDILIYCLALLLSGTVTAKAQDKMETSLGTDIVSSYVWRGMELGDVSMQPTLGVSYKGLSLSSWGSFGLSNPLDTKELDLTLGYSSGRVNIGITDYWFNAGPDQLNRYFKYGANETNHIFEANVGYDFGVASLQWFTNFAGNDLSESTGKFAYSSYFELSIPFSLGCTDWNASAGFVPFATSFYGTEGFAVTNLALTARKEIQVTDSFSIPLSAQLVANPYTLKSYLMFGITIQP